MSNIYDIEVTTIDHNVLSLGHFQGKVLLIVNVASKCGFTTQYEGLEALYKKYGDEGLIVLGFPCNQFGVQEPGSEEEIANFCSLTYDVTFPMFAKVQVNGKNTHPLFKHLKNERSGIMGSSAIKWNFTKFLVDHKGAVVARFASSKTPAAIENNITALLSKL